jgi:predicted molibdopterin-dependent oxidoreductase YjgC
VLAAANLINLLGRDRSSLQIPAEYSNTYGMYHAGVRPDSKGIKEMFYGSDSPVSAMYIMGEDPVTSFPDSSRVIETLKSLRFLVVQDIFMTETAKLADVILPASSWAEKDGTFTNTEGVIQKVYRLVDPTGQAMPDWMILKNLSLTMEKELGFRSLQEIQEEMKSEALKNPVAEARKKFVPVEYAAPAAPDGEFPFSLVIRDILQHSGSMSTSSKSLDLVVSEALLEVNENDAEKIGISDNSHVRLVSPQGSVFLKAKVSEEVPAGTVFVPTHFPHAKINTLTSMSSNGEAPIISVKVEKA